MAARATESHFSGVGFEPWIWDSDLICNRSGCDLTWPRTCLPTLLSGTWKQAAVERPRAARSVSRGDFRSRVELGCVESLESRAPS